MEMNKKIKIIDLLCLISNGEEVPKKIKFHGYTYELDNNGYNKDYYSEDAERWLFFDRWALTNNLNDEAEILDDEEDKDIPLIPDDELNEIQGNNNQQLNYNFKVLKEKINQVVEEFNEYRKDHE